MPRMLSLSKSDLTRHFPINEKQFLFHYTTFSSALGILLSQQMRLSPLANMNDPLEFEDHHNEPLVFDGFPSNEYLISKISDYEEAVTEKEKSVRLASFSMDMPIFNTQKGGQENCYNNLSKGWARSRMWAQYADNHKGVCLIFEKDNLEKNFKNHFHSNSCKTYCREVNYTNNLDPIREALCQPCKSLLTPDKINFLFQKCQDFRDEQEFRLLLINSELKKINESISFPIESSICGVITGVRFPKEDKPALQQAIQCCNPEIKRFSLWWEYGMPQIT